MSVTWNTKAVPGPYPDSKDWHDLRVFDPDREERPVVFGATDAAAACGVSPHVSQLDLYLRKRGELTQSESTDAMIIGRCLEDGVCRIYEYKTGKTVVRNLPMYFHGDYPFIGATPDALGLDDAGNVLEGVDAKTSTYMRYDEFGGDDDKFGQEGTDQLPVDYVLQGQQQCAVLDLDAVVFPVLFDGRHMKLYQVERNDELIESIIVAEHEMLERIVNADPPEPDYMHGGVRKAISRLHGLVPGQVIQLNEEDASLWYEYQKLGTELKEIKDRRAEIAARLSHVLGAAEIGRLPKGEKELRRVVVRESFFTEEDVEEVRAKVGQKKRSGYERLIERKAKS